MVISREKYENLNKLVDAQRELIDALNKKIDALEEYNKALKEVVFCKKGACDESN